MHDQKKEHLTLLVVMIAAQFISPLLLWNPGVLSWLVHQTLGFRHFIGIVYFGNLMGILVLVPRELYVIFHNDDLRKRREAQLWELAKRWPFSDKVH